MTALLISTLQAGIDLLDYQDIPPYLELLAEFVLLDDELQQYRMHRLFNEESVGLLYSIDKYKLNKSSQPSRYAYDVIKAIIDAAGADSPKALPFAAFVDGLRSPPHVTNPLTQQAEEQRGQVGVFLEWCRQFVVEYESQRVIERNIPAQACCEATRAVLQSLVDRRVQREAQEAAVSGSASPKSTQQLMFSEEHDGVQVQVLETIRANETAAEAFLQVVASNHGDETARLSITGLRNTMSSGAPAEPPNFSLKSLSLSSNNLPPRATRTVVLGPIYKLDPAQDWGGVALQWSCHLTGWPRPAVQVPSPEPQPQMMNNSTTTIVDSYNTGVSICDATQVHGDIRLAPAEHGDIETISQQEDLISSSGNVTNTAAHPNNNPSTHDVAI